MTKRDSRGREIKDWALGGIFGESGRLARPVTPGVLLVPGSIEIHGQRLVWMHERVDEKRIVVVPAGVGREKDRKLFGVVPTKSSPDYYSGGARDETVLIRKEATQPAKSVFADSEILAEFVRLADSSTDAIRDYALKWGVLGICKHGLPRTHNFRQSGLSHFCPPRGFRGDGDLDIVNGWEPLSAWRRYSRLALGILNIASRLHQGVTVDDERFWKRAGIRFMGYEDTDERRRRTFQQFALSTEVNGWLELANVRPFFSWGEDEEATIALGTTILWFSLTTQKDWLPLLPHLHGTTLFGALGIQLLMAVSRKEGFAICSACGSPYTPKRRPNPTRRHYCDKCGVKAAWRNAQQDRRSKLRKRKDSIEG
jgi:hypothetical protein